LTRYSEFIASCSVLQVSSSPGTSFSPLLPMDKGSSVPVMEVPGPAVGSWWRCHSLVRNSNQGVRGRLLGSGRQPQNHHEAKGYFWAISSSLGIRRLAHRFTHLACSFNNNPRQAVNSPQGQAMAGSLQYCYSLACCGLSERE
jgi:hypothetical protein